MKIENKVQKYRKHQRQELDIEKHEPEKQWSTEKKWGGKNNDSITKNFENHLRKRVLEMYTKNVDIENNTQISSMWQTAWNGT